MWEEPVMELNEQLKAALQELRKEKKRKFDQTVDLVVNLQKFNIKKESVNTVVSVPHSIKQKNVAAFLEVAHKGMDTITLSEFPKYKGKAELKKLVRSYDFFIAQASLMPKVATTFGKVLGPAGKMPSPQLGIIAQADDKVIDALKEKINKSVKIRTKEASIKVAVGKESMTDDALVENIMSVYNALVKELARDKENIKNLEVKFTMTKPMKIKLR